MFSAMLLTLITAGTSGKQSGTFGRMRIGQANTRRYSRADYNASFSDTTIVPCASPSRMKGSIPLSKIA
ncbi:hypothetical protein EMPG_14340 [Blastomyces silverae]|uniref:Secreted protein n=1 Tax=Blastomyces silverae TaxID=2060906 RepID=A0A0H1BFW4_9EURO|nr:hypothetical protein EMPG_14340 [Blastomyces silverae]